MPAPEGLASRPSARDGQRRCVEAADPEQRNRESRARDRDRARRSGCRPGVSAIEADEKRLLDLRGGSAHIEQHAIGIGLLDGQPLALAQLIEALIVGRRRAERRRELVRRQVFRNYGLAGSETSEPPASARRVGTGSPMASEITESTRGRDRRRAH